MGASQRSVPQSITRCALRGIKSGTESGRGRETRRYNAAMRLDHDTSYKQLFAHPELVSELLALCLPSRRPRRLDAHTCERVNASYASDSGRQRHGDMVWHVQPDDLYVVLEFQAQPDRWMAVRMQVYIGLLYQDLIKQGRILPGDAVPPVLPVVLYDGLQAWPLDIETRRQPAGLRRYQRQQRYLLLDLVRYLASPANDGGSGSVLTALFECTHLGTALRLPASLKNIAAWLERHPGEALRRSVTRWVKAHLRRRFKGITISSSSSLEEVLIMHGRQFDTFIDALRYETLQEGIEQGMERGLERGLQSGRMQTLRDVLRRLLERQAGPLTPAAAAKIDEATPELLQQWLDRAIEGDWPLELLEVSIE